MPLRTVLAAVRVTRPRIQQENTVSNIKQSIDVDVPVRVAYDQWTQFESFPQFMGAVESIEQVTDTKNRWHVSVGGVKRDFVTEITEQTPDQRIAWKTVDGDIGHAGVVTFHHLDDHCTRVNLDMDVDPDGFIEQVGDKLGIMSAQTKADMERFKDFIETRNTPTGGWRGKVERND
jgi:uncharacterized membrane protein